MQGAFGQFLTDIGTGVGIVVLIVLALMWVFPGIRKRP